MMEPELIQPRSRETSVLGMIIKPTVIDLNSSNTTDDPKIFTKWNIKETDEDKFSSKVRK